MVRTDIVSIQQKYRVICIGQNKEKERHGVRWGTVEMLGTDIVSMRQNTEKEIKTWDPVEDKYSI